jgi:hypothetical protein
MTGYLQRIINLVEEMDGVARMCKYQLESESLAICDCNYAISPSSNT